MTPRGRRSGARWPPNRLITYGQEDLSEGVEHLNRVLTSYAKSVIMDYPDRKDAGLKSEATRKLTVVYDLATSVGRATEEWLTSLRSERDKPWLEWLHGEMHFPPNDKTGLEARAYVRQEIIATGADHAIVFGASALDGSSAMLWLLHKHGIPFDVWWPRERNGNRRLDRVATMMLTPPELPQATPPPAR